MTYTCFIYFEPLLYLIDTVCVKGMETHIDTAQRQRDYTLNRSFICSRSGRLGGSSHVSQYNCKTLKILTFSYFSYLYKVFPHRLEKSFFIIPIPKCLL